MWDMGPSTDFNLNTITTTKLHCKQAYTKLQETATDMWDMGSSPSGGKAYSSTVFNLNTITTTQLHCKQAYTKLQETSTTQTPSKIMYVS